MKLRQSSDADQNVVANGLNGPIHLSSQKRRVYHASIGQNQILQGEERMKPGRTEPTSLQRQRAPAAMHIAQPTTS